jgi:plasmid segregation protein ParM
LDLFANEDTGYDVMIETERGRRHLFLGELAQRECREATINLSSEKYKDADTEALWLLTLGLMAQKNEPLHVVTGLPLAHYKRQKDVLQAELMGMAGTITLHGKTRNVQAESVRVVPQAMGAIMAGLLDVQTLQPRDAHLLRRGGYVLLVDVGTRTTGFVTFQTRPFQYIEALSDSIDVGGNTLHQALAQVLQNATGETPSPSDTALYQELLETGEAFFAGQVVSAAAQVERVRERVGRTILRQIVAKLGAETLNHVHAVFVAGGGSGLVVDVLRSQFSSVQVVDHAQMANAHGFRLFELAKQG